MDIKVDAPTSLGLLKRNSLVLVVLLHPRGYARSDDISASDVSFGKLGLMNDKAAVGVSFDVAGVSIAAVNAHLEAHSEG